VGTMLFLNSRFSFRFCGFQAARGLFYSCLLSSPPRSGAISISPLFVYALAGLDLIRKSASRSWLSGRVLVQLVVGDSGRERRVLTFTSLAAELLVLFERLEGDFATESFLILLVHRDRSTADGRGLRMMEMAPTLTRPRH
jgi:hypothetical protein